ncbi:MAG: hypothetical protein H8E76_05045 [Helicobacteraceae bacterium]|nr:hypothetical protein [Candidatus Sulfurimonas ponti]MBL6972932.1 hypothetical protein [Sulfurimonas sp.]
MKLYSVFFSLSLAATLNAGETVIEKYTELRNQSNIIKIQKYRNTLLQQRNINQELRDSRSDLRNQKVEALYARLERNPISYR